MKKSGTKDFITFRFQQLYKKRWLDLGKHHFQFAMEINKLVPDSKCTDQYVYRWYKGDLIPGNKYLPAICKVLGVDESEFSPRTHFEKYRYNSNYADGLEGRLEELAEQNVKIDLTFFQGLRNIIPDFDNIFPCYSPIHFHHKGEYYKRLNPAESSETSSGKGLFQIEKDGKIVFMSKYDLKIIKELQDVIAEKAAIWFAEVSEKLKEAEAEAIQKFKENNYNKWILRVLSETELQEIDPLGMYTAEERQKYSIPEGPIYTEETED